jgi:hypothetical protein
MSIERWRVVRAGVGAFLASLTLVACEEFKPPHNTAVGAGGGDAGIPDPGEVDEIGADDVLDGAVAAEEPEAVQSDGGVAADAPRNPLSFARATPRYVFVANPRARTVAVIDPLSRKVQHASCPGTPSLLAASEYDDVAVAFEPESGVGCVLRVQEGAVTSSELRLVADANTLTFSADARFALAYHDRRLDAQDAPRFSQDVSVVALKEAPRSLDVTVGIGPSEVVFAEKEPRAFVVSAAGVSTIDLSLLSAASAAAPGVPAEAPVRARAPARSFGSAERLTVANVRVAQRGTRALTFEPEGNSLYVLDLGAEGPARLIDLSAWARGPALAQAGSRAIDRLRIADAAIEADGANAWLALRGEQTLLRVPLAPPVDLALVERISVPGQASDRLTLTNEQPGALFVSARSTGDGRARLVSLAAPTSTQEVLLPAATEKMVGTRDLALLHGGPEFVGYSLVRASDGASLFFQSEREPLATAALAKLGVTAFALAPTAEQSGALHLVYAPDLSTEVFALDGAPLSVGFCSAIERAFVQETHSDGRLSFIDLANGQKQTLTGFLISARVQE